MTRKQFRELAPPEKARDLIESLDVPTRTTTVPLADARDRVLAERIDAPIDVPGFDRSTMDGYAVRATDTFGADEANPMVLTVTGSVHTGEPPDGTVEPGTTVEISTGAVLPNGADAVVMVERTDPHPDGVAITTAVAPGDHVMTAGADIAAGSRALGPGTRITPRELGLLAALGQTEIPVIAPPVVGILSTGDELVQPGEPLDHTAGEIYDVNTHTLAAAIHEAGGNPITYPTAPDTYDDLKALLDRAADECTLVISSGSTSAGAADIIHHVIQDHGTLHLHGVAVKPGKPMLVGTINDTPFIGLPGYPVSALTIYRTFVDPVVRTAAGNPPAPTETVTGRMAVREYTPEHRLRFMPVGLIEDHAGDLLVYPVDKGSGATTSLVDADGFIEIPATTDQLNQHDPVTVRLFSPDVHPPRILGVGEDDPLVTRLLDHLDHPRYLPAGTQTGYRRLRDDIADFAVLTGPTGTTTRPLDGPILAELTREWGLILPPGNPNGVTGLDDLLTGDLRFVNRDRPSGLRHTLDAALDDLASAQDTTREDLTTRINGYALTTNAHESPARKVANNTADVGLGLRTTATRLDLDFVTLGHEPLRIIAHPDRTEKPAVRTLTTLLDDLPDLIQNTPGYHLDIPAT